MISPDHAPSVVEHIPVEVKQIKVKDIEAYSRRKSVCASKLEASEQRLPGVTIEETSVLEASCVQQLDATTQTRAIIYLLCSVTDRPFCPVSHANSRE